MWKDLSIKEKAALINIGVKNGLYDLEDIKNSYNKYAKGGPINPYSAGSLVDTIYKNSKKEEYLGEPSHHYDFTISEEEANRLGYYPDKRGHRDDRVKKPTHPTHPSRGKWNSLEEFELTDKGMENPNYTLFGLNDGGQDPQAVMTYKGGVVLPEITVTPKKKYVYNPYDNINIYTKSEDLQGYDPLSNKQDSNKYAEGGYKPSSRIKKQIAKWEGSTMKVNRSFEDEAKDFNYSLPKGATSKLSQQQLDGLYSYSYNVGAGRFRQRVKPVLTKYLNGEATIQDVQRSMWASKDSQLRGLAKRRNVERSMFGRNYQSPLMNNLVTQNLIQSLPSVYDYKPPIIPQIEYTPDPSIIDNLTEEYTGIPEIMDRPVEVNPADNFLKVYNLLNNIRR